MKDTQTYPLRLPRSLKDAVERLSREDRTSINQFVTMAVAEKVSALQTAQYLGDRKARADFKAFDKTMKRRRGEPPRPGDEVHVARASGLQADVAVGLSDGKPATRRSTRS